MPRKLPRPASFISRWDYILDRCRGKKVLHLGFVGMTDLPSADKLAAAARGQVLHADLRTVACELHGVDLDADAVARIRDDLHWDGVFVGDAERLDEVAGLAAPYDVVVVGDLIEHITRPGQMLEGLKPLVGRDGTLIISTPNAFGLMGNLRVTWGRYVEGDQHVLNFNAATLTQMLSRHGWEMTELYTGYNTPPRSTIGRVKVAIGSALLSRMPNRGGTLIAAARLA